MKVIQNSNHAKDGDGRKRHGKVHVSCEKSSHHINDMTNPGYSQTIVIVIGSGLHTTVHIFLMYQNRVRRKWDQKGGVFTSRWSFFKFLTAYHPRRKITALD